MSSSPKTVYIKANFMRGQVELWCDTLTDEERKKWLRDEADNEIKMRARNLGEKLAEFLRKEGYEVLLTS